MNSAVSYLPESMQEPAESYVFARKTTDEILEAVGDYRGGRMDINVYMPRYILGSPEGGFIRLSFQKEDAEPALIGVSFGETAGENEVVRFGFDRESWEKYPNEPHSGGINAFNFDEAWRIICLLGTDLVIQQVTISYGKWSENSGAEPRHI